MKVYTVYQPYAFATVAGLKPHETRPRRTNIRGRVAVHAGAAGFDAAMKGRTREDINKISAMQHESPFTENVLFRGGIIGTVEIVDCVPVEEIVDTLTERERLLGDYSPGRFAWVLQNPVMFDTPIPARGQQGWWNWNAHKACGTCENESYCEAFFLGRYTELKIKEPEALKTSACKLYSSKLEGK